MSKGLIYTRVSSKDQVDGTSLPRQEAECQAFARKNDVAVAEECIFREEGESAKVADRTELRKLIEYAKQNKKEIEYLYIWKIDRLARNLSDYYAIKVLLAQYEIKIISVTEPIDDDPVGRFLEAILAAAAQFDNEIRALRTTGGMRARVEQGAWPHSAAIGYKKRDKHVIIDPVFGPVVRELLIEFSKGGYSYADIAQLAFKKGIKTKSGKPKTTDQMKHMMCNYMYAGLTVNKLAEKPVKGKHKALVDLEVIKKNIAIVEGTINNYSLHGDDLFPLRGTLVCVVCEKFMTGSIVRGQGGAYPRYFCTRKTCTIKASGRKLVSQSVDVAHEDFRKLLNSLKPLNKGVAQLYKTIVMRVWNDEFKANIESANELQRKITRQEQLKFSITKKHIEDKITDEEKALQMAAAERELLELEGELEELTLDKDSSEKLIDTAMEFIENPEKFWNHASTPVKKLVQQFIAPNGLPYDFETGFRTPEGIESYLLIKKIGGKSAENTGLVAATRIELVTSGL